MNSKNVILASQIVLSGIFLFLAYGGRIKPSLHLAWAVAICVFLIGASRILLNKKRVVWATVLIAIHLLFVGILPLNS
jgi:hypothetical protein